MSTTEWTSRPSCGRPARTWPRGGISQGGSTITQQYVGNVFLDRSEQTATRKIVEFFMARRFEQFFTKDFILLRYLNWVYFGNGAYGIEAASRQYFGAPACELTTTAAERGQGACLKVSELTLEQAALLAGLIQRPSAFDPYRNPQDARRRRNLVLERMLANEFITVLGHEQAVDQPIVLIEDVPILEERYRAAYFVEDVKQWFLDNPAFGPTREYRTQLLFEGGLAIHTTIDLKLQAKAEAAVEAYCPTPGSIPTPRRRSWAWAVPRTATSWPWSVAATSSATTRTPSSTWRAARAARPVRP